MAWLIKKFLFLIVLCAAPILFGCEGSEPREQIDDTVKELSGQKTLERMDEMKKDIGEIENQQKDRMKQLEESAEK